jgi:hypothetical protein
MKKDCFSQDFVDAEKFRECATCHLFDECTQTVTLKGAKKASYVGQGLGFLVAAATLGVALMTWGSMPHGAPWLAFTALVYALSIYRAGKEYGAENLEQREHLGRAADAKPLSGPAPDAHGAHH